MTCQKNIHEEAYEPPRLAGFLHGRHTNKANGTLWAGPDLSSNEFVLYIKLCLGRWKYSLVMVKAACFWQNSWKQGSVGNKASLDISSSLPLQQLVGQDSFFKPFLKSRFTHLAPLCTLNLMLFLWIAVIFLKNAYQVASDGKFQSSKMNVIVR